MSVPWGGTLRAKGDDLGPTLLLPGTPPVLPGVAAEMGKSIQCNILLLVFFISKLGIRTDPSNTWVLI